MISKHKKLNAWVKQMAAMCQPEKIVWIDGSIEEKERLEKEDSETVTKCHGLKMPATAT